MARLGSCGNVYNTCLRILQKRGYRLWAEETNDAGSVQWWAAKGDFDFVGDNPIELLGLVAISDYHSPGGDEGDYWWAVDGPDLYRDLLLCAVPSVDSGDTE